MNPMPECQCEYCKLDRTAGVTHEVCPFRIELLIVERADGWYAVAELNDGAPMLSNGPHKTEAEAHESARAFAAVIIKHMPDLRVVHPS